MQAHPLAIESFHQRRHVAINCAVIANYWEKKRTITQPKTKGGNPLHPLNENKNENKMAPTTEDWTNQRPATDLGPFIRTPLCHLPPTHPHGHPHPLSFPIRRRRPISGARMRTAFDPRSPRLFPFFHSVSMARKEGVLDTMAEQKNKIPSK